MELNLENKYINTNKLLKIKLDSRIKDYYLGIDKNQYYSMISLKQFLDYFFPSNFDYIILHCILLSRRRIILIRD